MGCALHEEKVVSWLMTDQEMAKDVNNRVRILPLYCRVVSGLRSWLSFHDKQIRPTTARGNRSSRTNP
jgi:hypothetical protein